MRSPASSSAGTLETLEIRSDAARVPRVTITLHEDSSGGIWRITPIAIDTNEVDELRLQHAAGDINLEIRPLSEVIPPDDLRETEMKWLRENQSELAAHYPGEWIAIDGTQLVAHAGDLPTLLKKAEKAGHPNPFVTAIPSQRVTSLHV